MENRYKSPYADNPYMSAGVGLRRRAQEAVDPEGTDPEEGNWAGQTIRSVAANQVNNYENLLPALAKGVTGDTDGMRESARAYQADNERAKALGPDVQDFDTEQGVGYNLKALAYQGANMLPDMVGGIGAGVVAGGMARSYARKAIGRSVMRNELADTAEQIAAKRAAADAAGAAARAQAVAEAGSTPAAVSARVRGAMASSDDAFKAGNMAEALKFAGRTPARIAQLDRATKVGAGVGAGLSQVASLNTTNADRLASADTDQSDAQTMLGGTGVAAALSFIPVNRLLSRFGSKATAEVAQMGERFLPRVAREYAAQGIAEGSTEALQQAAQLASHAWMDKNWDTLVGSDARSEILMSGILGGVMGGAFGAAGEVGRSGVDAIGSGVGAVARGAGTAKTKILESLAKVAETRRAAFKDKPAAGQPMEGEADATSKFSEALKSAGGVARDLKDLAVAKTQIAAHKFGVQFDKLEEADAQETEAQQRADAVDDALSQASQTGELRLRGSEFPYVAYPGLNKAQNLLLSYVHPAAREDAGRRGALAGALDGMMRGKTLDANEETLLKDIVDAGAMDQVTLDILRLNGDKVGALLDSIEQGRKYEEDTEAEYGAAIALDQGESGGYQNTDAGSAELDANDDGEQQAALLSSGADLSEVDAKIDETDFNSGINTTGGERVQAPDERMESARITIQGIKKRLAEYKALPPKKQDPKFIAQIEAEREAAIADGKAARDELRQTVLGRPAVPKKRKDGKPSKFGKPFGAFVFDKNPTNSAPYDAALKDPAYMAITGQVNASLSEVNPDMRDGLLNIAHATQSMASNTRRNDDVSEEQKNRDAFFRVLQNAELSGVELNYATLTPGEVKYFGRKKDPDAPAKVEGEEDVATIDDDDKTAPGITLFTLTDADIKNLRTANTKQTRAMRAEAIAQVRDIRKNTYSKKQFVAKKKAQAGRVLAAKIRKTTGEAIAKAKKAGKKLNADDARREAVRLVSAQLQRQIMENPDQYQQGAQNENTDYLAELAWEEPEIIDGWLSAYAKSPRGGGEKAAEWRKDLYDPETGQLDTDILKMLIKEMRPIWQANAQKDGGNFEERFNTPYMERPTQLNVPYESPRGELGLSAGSRRFEFTPSIGVASMVNLSSLSSEFDAAYKAAIHASMKAHATARDVFTDFEATDEAAALRAARKQHGPLVLQLQKFGMRIKKAEAEAAAGADATQAALLKVAATAEEQAYHAALPRAMEETGASALGAVIDNLYDNPDTYAAVQAYQQLKRERADAAEYGDTSDADMAIREFMETKQGAMVKNVSAAFKRYNEKTNEAAVGARAIAEEARVRAMDGTKRKRTQAMLDKAVVNAYDSLSTFLGRADTREGLKAFEEANAEYGKQIQKMLDVGSKPTEEEFGRAMWASDINAQRTAGKISETMQKLMLARAADPNVKIPERFRPALEEEGKVSLVEAREDTLQPLSYKRDRLDAAGRDLLRRVGKATDLLLAGDKTIKKRDKAEPSDREIAEAIYTLADQPKTYMPAGQFDEDFIANVRRLTDGWPESSRVVEALDDYDALRKAGPSVRPRDKVERGSPVLSRDPQGKLALDPVDDTPQKTVKQLAKQRADQVKKTAKELAARAKTTSKGKAKSEPSKVAKSEDKPTLVPFKTGVRAVGAKTAAEAAKVKAERVAAGGAAVQYDELSDIDAKIETIRASMQNRPESGPDAEDAVGAKNRKIAELLDQKQKLQAKAHPAQAALETAAQAEPNAHDNAKYQDMANATLDAAGVKMGVKVVSGATNSYNKKTKTVTLRDDLKGPERVEVLMHEVGHHIVWNEIAKSLQNGWADVKKDKLTLEEGMALLEYGNPTLYRALMKDFNAWRSTHRKYAGKTDFDIRASRAPLHRSQRADRYSAAGKGKRATRADFTGADVFHEWMADQIARALTTQAKPRSIVETFFADIATALRAAWDALTGGERSKYAPYSSVDNWIAGMFDPARAEVSGQVGQTATEGQAETALRAAFADTYDVDDVDSMKEYVKDVLRPEERLILERALSTPMARRILAEAYAGSKKHREALNDAEQSLENRIALAYPLWKSGAFKVGPNGSSAFNGISDNLVALLDVAGGSAMAERIFTDIASGKIEKVRRAGREYDVRRVEARARGKRQQAFNKVSLAVERVMRPLDKFWTAVGARLEDTGIPALRELRSVLVRPQGATGDYDRGITPAIQHATGRWMTRTQHALEGLSPKHRVTTMDAMQRQLTGEVLAKKPKEVQQAVKKLRTIFSAFHTYLAETGLIDEKQKIENFFPVVMDVHNDHAAQVLTEVYSDPRFEDAIRRLSFNMEKPGQGPSSSEAKAKAAPAAPALKLEAALAAEDARRKYMEYIATKKAMWPETVHETNTHIINAVEAAPSLRSLEGMLAKSIEREERYNGRADVLDAIGYEQRYIQARMKEFGAEPAPRTKVGKLAAAGDAPEVPSTRPIKDLVKELVSRATNDNARTEQMFDPINAKAKSERQRLSGFVYELGDAAIIKRFASVQSKDMAAVMAGYIEPMVRRAEAARYFGPKREKLDALLARAEKEGASKADLDLAEDAVKAALGTYGAAGSPTIAQLSPGLAQKLHGDKARAFMEGAQAYQNARLLPLSLLSSLVDPMGIAVRAGGDMGLAFDSWKEGMRSLRDVATRKDLQAMLEQIGSADDMPAIAFTAGFGGHKDSLAHKVNETVFKWNGMSTWVRTTRYMAVVAAHGFLLKHGRGETELSRRYLSELNLQSREIPRDPANKHRVEILTPSEYKRASKARRDVDDRVRTALQEFVDNAVLRPNSTQQPLWYSDPYMGLITQYKAFGYAIFNQIGGRIAHEWKNGNHRVLLAALAYVPIGMMAELLREFIQYGFDGHPKRAEWGATEYASMSAQRSGLFGPKTGTLTDIAGDIQYRRTPGTSLTGPVIGQATNLLDGKNTAGDFESALPASPLWRNHINPLGGGEAVDTSKEIPSPEGARA